LADVLSALRRFVEHVAKLHPGKRRSCMATVRPCGRQRSYLPTVKA
jgi:hypothetical protein